MATPSDSFNPYRLWLQVSDDARPPTHYQLLGLPVGERDPEVIRQATLMRSAHVRHFQKGEHGDAAARVLEELAEASRILLDPGLRVAYEATVNPPTALEPAPATPTRTPVAAVVRPAAVRPRAVVPVEPEVDAPPRPRRKHRRTRSRRASTFLIIGVVLVSALGGTAYVASVLNQSSAATRAAVEATKQAAPPVATGQALPPDESVTPARKGPPADPVVAAPPSPPVKDTVRLSVDPPTALLDLETPAGKAAANAAIEGEGDARRIVSEKGTLPLVVVAVARGYKPLRVKVGPADLGRVVPVLLSRETQANPLDSARNLPSPWLAKGKGKRYRMAGDFLFLLHPSSEGHAPAWRYTAERPDADWAEWGYDDSRWAQGQAAFATALGDEFKVRSGRKGDLVSAAFGRTLWQTQDLWLRAAIDLPANIRLGQIRWNYRADDEIAVFVNGREEFAETRATWRAQRITNPEHFLPGRNVIAVHARNQEGAGLVDVGFEWLELREVR